MMKALLGCLLAMLLTGCSVQTVPATQEDTLFLSGKFSEQFAEYRAQKQVWAIVPNLSKTKNAVVIAQEEIGEMQPNQSFQVEIDGEPVASFVVCDGETVTAYPSVVWLDDTKLLVKGEQIVDVATKEVTTIVDSWIPGQAVKQMVEYSIFSDFVVKREEGRIYYQFCDSDVERIVYYDIKQQIFVPVCQGEIYEEYTSIEYGGLSVGAQAIYFNSVNGGIMRYDMASKTLEKVENLNSGEAIFGADASGNRLLTQRYEAQKDQYVCSIYKVNGKEWESVGSFVQQFSGEQKCVFSEQYNGVFIDNGKKISFMSFATNEQTPLNIFDDTRLYWDDDALISFVWYDPIEKVAKWIAMDV